MVNRPSVAPPLLIVKGNDRGHQALTKRFHGLDSWLVLGPSHNKYFKSGSGSCLHAPQHKYEPCKHNWFAQCQYNVPGLSSMGAYDMLFQ